MHERIESELTMKIVVLGSGTVKYLEQVKNCMERQNKQCKLLHEVAISIESYKMVIDDFIQATFTAECRCIDLNPVKAVVQMQDHADVIREADIIINLFPIKYFGKLRYNVDEQWENAEFWILPLVYRNFLAHLIGKEKRSVWILTGMERIGLISDFLQREENTALLNPFTIQEPDRDSSWIQNAVMTFLKEIDEEEFAEAFQDGNLYFGFSAETGLSTVVGANAADFWCLKSFEIIYR